MIPRKTPCFLNRICPPGQADFLALLAGLQISNAGWVHSRFPQFYYNPWWFYVRSPFFPSPPVPPDLFKKNSGNPLSLRETQHGAPPSWGGWFAGRLGADRNHNPPK